MTIIIDPEVNILAAISGTLEIEYTANETAWNGSPFAWIKTRPSRQVGAIGEKLVSGWLATKGFNVIRSPDSDADRIIESSRVEIKFSTLWQSGGYKFQQLRDQNYDFAICLGISPFNAHCWVLEKSLILAKWGDPNGLPNQHGGSRGVDTVWLSVDPNSPQEWLSKIGGSLLDGVNYISRLTGYKPDK